MALTVRLDPRTERVLKALAKRRGQTQSDVVREAIEQFGADQSRVAASRSTYAAWSDVIGIVRSGARDPNRTTGEQFADIIAKKARARRPR